MFFRFVSVLFVGFLGLFLLLFEVAVVVKRGGVSRVLESLFSSWMMGLWRSMARPPEAEEEEEGRW